MYKISDKIISFIPEENIEKEALEQIKNTASVPFLFRHDNYMELATTIFIYTGCICMVGALIAMILVVFKK